MEPSKNILITGGTGLIGTALSRALVARGDQVSCLTRSKSNGAVRSFQWDVERGSMDDQSLTGVDTIVHLAGAGVFDKRWTKKRKQEILESRTNSTRLLFQELESKQHQVRSFISASAIGYYGFGDSEREFVEDDKPGTDFLAQVTQQWEQQAEHISQLGIRVVRIRVGIVLSAKGGALKQMATPVRFLVGAPLADGKQVVSWIHIDDLCGIFLHAIDHPSMTGAYNAVAPNPVTNRKLTELIAEAMNKPLLMPAVPAFALKLLLGEMGKMVTRGSKVSAAKILDAGYQFKFLKARDAVNDLLSRR